MFIKKKGFHEMKHAKKTEDFFINLTKNIRIFWKKIIYFQRIGPQANFFIESQNLQNINFFIIFCKFLPRKGHFSWKVLSKIIFTFYLKHQNYPFCAPKFHPVSETESYNMYTRTLISFKGGSSPFSIFGPKVQLALGLLGKCKKNRLEKLGENLINLFKD